jgi:hypothetical protein
MVGELGHAWARMRAGGWRARLQEVDARRALAFGATLVVVAWVFWILARHLTYSNWSPDEAWFVWEGWSINRGLVPYRDFFDFKPPVIFLSNALALRWLGLEHDTYRYAFTALAGSSVVAVAAALLSRKVPKLLVLGLSFVIFGLWLDPHWHDSSLNDAESIGIAFFLLGAASFLFESRAKSATDFLGGVLASLSVLSKEPMALSVVPMWLAMLALAHGAGGRERALRFAKRSLAGVALVLVLLLGYFIVTGSLGWYLKALRMYAPFAKTICITYGLWKPSTFWHDWTVRINNLTGALVNVTRLGVAVPLLVAPLVLARGRQWAVTLAALGTVAGSLYAVTLGGCFFVHYYMLGMAGLFFLMIVGALFLGQATQRAGAPLRRWAILAAALLPAWSIWPRYDAERDIAYRHPEGHYNLEPELYQFILDNTKPTDTIFTTGQPSIYVHTNRRHATREAVFFDSWLTLYPGATDEERLAPIRAELEQSRPKVIVLEPYLAYQRVRHMELLITPYMQAHGYKKVKDNLYLRPD